MTLRRVLPDANVCYPIVLLDLILRLDEARFHHIIWSEDLLDELTRVWVAKGSRSTASAARICEDIRSAFAGQEVRREEYGHLVADMPGRDPDDRRHSAAASVRAPATIVTANIRDFPVGPLAKRGVTVLRPDAYLCELLDAHAVALTAVISEIASDRKNPPMAATDVLDALTRAGVPRFSARARPLLP